MLDALTEFSVMRDTDVLGEVTPHHALRNSIFWRTAAMRDDVIECYGSEQMNHQLN